MKMVIKQSDKFVTIHGGLPPIPAELKLHSTLLVTNKYFGKSRNGFQERVVMAWSIILLN